MNFIRKMFDHEYKELKKFEHQADAIMELEEEMSNLTDTELKAKTEEFKERLKKGETLDDILVEAFAVAREASYRVIGEKPFYVQLLGGQAGRDAEWMGGIHRFLGLTVGVNSRDLSAEEKQEQYACDILYTTNNELGFDYLRDNMVVHKEERVQRPLNFAIIDEVDSVLIDEARTPLIISGGQMQSANLYIDADRFVKGLKLDEDYIYDEKTKSVNLNDSGSVKAEKMFHIDNLYDINNATLVHYILIM